MRRILVTGGCGFIGSHFVRRLLRRHDDVEVVNLDALTYAGNPANLADVADSERYRFVHGSICDADAVAECRRGLRRDRQLRRRDARRPLDHGGRRLHPDRRLRHVPPARVRSRDRGGRLVHVSTDEVYGDIEPGHASREGDALRPSSPYSASKAGGDLQVLACGAHLRRRRRHHARLEQLRAQPVPREADPAVHDEPARRRARAGLRRRPPVARLHLRRGSLRGHRDGARARRERRDLQRRRRQRDREPDDHDAPARAHRTRREPHPLRHRPPGPRPPLRARHEQAAAPRLERPRSTFDEGLQRTVDWYRENRAWWEPIKSGGGFAEYRRKQYGGAGR